MKQIGGEGSHLQYPDPKTGKLLQPSATFHSTVAMPVSLPLWAQVANLCTHYGKDAVMAALGATE